MWAQRKYRRAIISFSVVAIIAIAITFVPTVVARYLLAQELAELGLQQEGLKTLRVNLWTREAWVGPLQVNVPGNDPARLNELGIKFRISALFKKRAMIEHFVVRGINVVVARAEDNSVTVNGVAPEQIFPNDGPEDPEAAATLWGAGLGEFELRDSRVFFQDKTGGVLKVEVESLFLGNFRTWEPERPGTFRLKARVNDIELDWRGDARPFADNINLVVDSHTREANLPRVAEFTGPFGLDRRAGTYNSHLRHEVTLFASGRVEGESSGTIKLFDADYARRGQFEIQLAQADVDLSSRYALTVQGDLEVWGELTLSMGKVQGKFTEQRKFNLQAAQVKFKELQVDLGHDRALQIKSKPEFQIENGNFDGQVQLSVDRMLTVLSYLQSLSAEEPVTAEQTGLGDWSSEDVRLPESEISVAQLQGAATQFDLSSSSGLVALKLALRSDLDEVEVKTAERSTRVKSWHSELEGLKLASGAGKLKLDMAGQNVFLGNKLKGPVGQMQLDRVKADINNFGLGVEQGKTQLRLSAEANVKGTQLSTYELEGLPSSTATIGSVKAVVKNASLNLAGQKTAWQARADGRVDKLVMKFANGTLAAGKFNRLELQDAGVDQNLNLETRSLTVSGLDLSLTRRFIDNLRASINPEQPASDKKAGKTQHRKTTVPQTDGKDKSQKAPFELKLGRVAVENGARLRFEDKQVEPPVTLETIFKTVELRDVDSRDPAKQAKLQLEASVNEFTHIELGGTASNLGPKVDLNLSGGVNNLELPPYSSYAVEFAGVNLESGQLTTTATATAKQGTLSGTVGIDLDDMKFSAVSEEDAKRLDEKAGFPLETAVGLLQDPQGRIKLALPIKGTVNAPSVDAGSAIRKAVGNTLKKILPSNLFSSADKTKGVTLASLTFKPGTTKLDAAGKNYANSLVELLQTHPRLSLDVCGRATAADFAELTGLPAVAPTTENAASVAPQKAERAVKKRARLLEKHQQKLRDLAVSRTRVVRRYLITEKGADPRRVAECRPAFNVDDLGPPRVEIKP